VAAWAEVVDLAALDPPEVCDRCHRPITPEDPLDYLEADDGSLEIVHERCPDTDPPGRRPRRAAAIGFDGSVG
jgi:hypothetical protein